MLERYSGRGDLTGEAPTLGRALAEQRRLLGRRPAQVEGDG